MLRYVSRGCCAGKENIVVTSAAHIVLPLPSRFPAERQSIKAARFFLNLQQFMLIYAIKKFSKDVMQDYKGLTLIELMIAVAIIGILTAVAVPNFISYRDKAKIAAGISTANTIRAAFAGYAQSDKNNLFPPAAAIVDWRTLKSVCNANGTALKSNEADQGVAFVSYSDKGDQSDYLLILSVKGVSKDLTGSQIEIAPSGIFKHTLGS
jgi:type IV pilus assembly protein PilA